MKQLQTAFARKEEKQIELLADFEKAKTEVDLAQNKLQSVEVTNTESKKECLSLNMIIEDLKATNVSMSQQILEKDTEINNLNKSIKQVFTKNEAYIADSLALKNELDILRMSLQEKELRVKSQNNENVFLMKQKEETFLCYQAKFEFFQNNLNAIYEEKFLESAQHLNEISKLESQINTLKTEKSELVKEINLLKNTEKFNSSLQEQLEKSLRQSNKQLNDSETQNGILKEMVNAAEEKKRELLRIRKESKTNDEFLRSVSKLFADEDPKVLFRRINELKAKQTDFIKFSEDKKRYESMLREKNSQIFQLNNQLNNERSKSVEPILDNSVVTRRKGKKGSNNDNEILTLHKMNEELQLKLIEVRD